MRKSTIAATVAASGLLALLPASAANAHGTMSNPPSRVYVCKNEGPETPQSAACKAAVAAGGTQAFYDWNEVSLLEAGGRHRELIPDGKLCSAGREKYRGLDLQRADWPATKVSPGAFTLTYHATAPHANSNFEFYITREGWNPTMPLKWSDLVPIKTFNGQNPTTFTNWTINLPQRTGRHILYSIWQRVVGSNEAFYTCSDVDFGGGTPSTPTPTPTPTTTPTPTPNPTATQPGGTWSAGTAYRAGDRVTYNGLTYECTQAHTALAGWEPPNVPALWKRA
ncbi:chitin-binding protein [Nonomuraea sp. FMUSA5-5]|uniref:Chitin-binding protein n=1 Tax=Nonomuraea composti TaxID=2720023 RepID=A0ABX1BGC2_9ACTN|nr:lytic polysaccharide monooxygenase [Nonomuraea sp. FMUSA5-5]NJP96819.1 chitin-binding protein [Nonomuraea sp. FMUSA5-5]